MYIDVSSFTRTIPIQVGHVDFYPNDGKAPQPGCNGEPIGLDCSHQRAHVRNILVK